LHGKNFFLSTFAVGYREKRKKQHEKSAKTMIFVSINCNLMLLARSKQLTVEEAYIFQSSSFDP